MIYVAFSTLIDSLNLIFRDFLKTCLPCSVPACWCCCWLKTPSTLFGVLFLLSPELRSSRSPARFFEIDDLKKKSRKNHNWKSIRRCLVLRTNGYNLRELIPLMSWSVPRLWLVAHMPRLLLRSEIVSHSCGSWKNDFKVMFDSFE